MRLIDADALERKWQDVLDEEAHKKGTVAYTAFELFIEGLKEEPTIDAKPVVHGEWDVIEDDYVGLTLIKCSVCHEEWCLEGKEEGIDMQLANYNFCPNCSAAMRERIET